MEEIIFRETGMDCLHETDALRKAVDALPGIRDVVFNLSNGTMFLTAVEGAIDVQGILTAVESTGTDAPRADDSHASVYQSDSRSFGSTHRRVVANLNKFSAGGCCVLAVALTVMKPSPVGFGF